MDKFVVNQALRALEEIGAVRTSGTQPSAALVSEQPVQEDGVTHQTIAERDEIAPCGSAHCAGCYEVGDGKKIHPPKIGKAYQKWTDQWSSRRVQ
jgi:hypothetical protein